MRRELCTVLTKGVAFHREDAATYLLSVCEDEVPRNCKFLVQSRHIKVLLSLLPSEATSIHISRQFTASTADKLLTCLSFVARCHLELTTR